MANSIGGMHRDRTGPLSNLTVGVSPNNLEKDYHRTSDLAQNVASFSDPTEADIVCATFSELDARKLIS